MDSTKNRSELQNTPQLPAQKIGDSNKTLCVTLTILFSILFCIFKLFSFGWLTIMALIPIITYLNFYIIYGNTFAKTKNKTKSDYVFFGLISFFFLSSGLFFSDSGDYGPPSQLIKSIPSYISLSLSLFSACITIILLITFAIVRKQRQIHSRQ